MIAHTTLPVSNLANSKRFYTRVLATLGYRQAADRKQVEAFHRAALGAGGRDNGHPGYRDYSSGYFAAFVLDPDGNNIEAVWYDPAKSS